MSKHRSFILITRIFLILSFVLTAVGIQPPRQVQAYDLYKGDYAVKIDYKDQRILLMSWTADLENIDVTLRDEEGTLLEKGAFGSGQNGHAYYYPAHPLLPGMSYRIEDKSTGFVREGTLFDFRVTGVNQAANTIFGIAKPNNSFRIYAGGQQIGTSSDSDGNWQVQFANLPVSVHSSLSVEFDDFWETYTLRTNPYFIYDPTGMLQVIGDVYPGTPAVRITDADGVEKFAAQPLTRCFVYQIGDYCLDILNAGADPQPGDQLLIEQNGEVITSAAVPDFTTLSIDFNGDGILAGTGPANTRLFTNWSAGFISTDENGNWIDPTNTQFNGTQMYFLAGLEVENGNQFGVRKWESDDFQFGKVDFSIDHDGYLNLVSWSEKERFLLEVYTSADETSRIYGEVFHPGYGADPNSASFYFPNLQPGYRVKISNYTSAQILDLPDLSIDAIDLEQDLISGSGPANTGLEITQIEMLNTIPDVLQAHQTTTDENGHWSIDFKNDPAVDLVRGASFKIAISKSEPGSTETYQRIIRPRDLFPYIDANITTDLLQVRNLNPGETVAVTILPPTGDDTPLYTGLNLLANENGAINLPFGEHQVNLSASQRVTVAREGSSLQMTISDLIGEDGRIDFGTFGDTPHSAIRKYRFCPAMFLSANGSSSEWYRYVDHGWTCNNAENLYQTALFDEQFNRTSARFDDSLTNSPTLAVNLTTNTISGANWGQSKLLNISIETTESQTIHLPAVNSSDFQRSLTTVPNYTLKPGDKVTVSRSAYPAYSLAMIVESLAAPTVDYATETVQGSGVDGRTICLLQGGDSRECSEIAGGAWSIQDLSMGSPVDLSPLREFTIALTKNGVAGEEECGQNCETRLTILPTPSLWVNADDNLIRLDRFTPPVQVSAYEKETDRLLASFTVNNGTGTVFAGEDLTTGDRVTVQDAAGHTENYTLQNITLTGVDRSIPAYDGTAEEGAFVYASFWHYYYPVVGPVTERNGENWHKELDPLSGLPEFYLCDSAGNCTWVDPGMPAISAALNSDQIHLEHFRPSTALSVSLVSPQGQFSPPIKVNSNASGSAIIDLAAKSIDLAPGSKIEVFDGSRRSSTFTAQTLTYASDTAARTLRGTAPANANLRITVLTRDGQTVQKSVFANNSGQWTFNYGTLYWDGLDIQALYIDALDNKAVHATRIQLDGLPAAAQALNLAFEQTGNDDIPQVDPHKAASRRDFNLIQQLFAGLTRLDANGNISPWLAESWTVSEDQKSFVFTLRSGLKWSDNTALTAYTVRDSLNRLKNLPAADAPFQSMVWSQINKITVIDTTHLQFDLKTANAAFPALLAEPAARPLPIHAINNQKSPELWPSSSAYRIIEWYVPDVANTGRIRLAKNTTYYANSAASPVYINILLRSFAEQEQMYNNGSLHLLENVLLPADDYRAGQLVTLNDPCSVFFAFNTTQEHVNNATFRRALSLALDRNALINNETLLPGPQRAASWFTPPIESAAPTPERYPNLGPRYNPAEATRLMNAYMTTKSITDPSEISVDLFTSYDEQSKALAYALENIWESRFGININVVEEDPEILPNRIKTENLSLWSGSWCATYNDAASFLGNTFLKNGAFNPTGAGINWTTGNYTVYATKLSDAARTGDLEARRQLNSEAENILVYNDAVILPLYWAQHNDLVRPEIRRTFGLVNSWGMLSDWRFNNFSVPTGPSQSATVKSSDDKISITAPAGTFGEPVTLKLGLISVTSPPRYRLISRAFKLEAISTATGKPVASLPAKNLAFTIRYDLPVPDKTVEESLRLYRLEADGRTWTPVAGLLNQTLRTFTAQAPLNGASTYALFASQPFVEVDLSDGCIRGAYFGAGFPVRVRIDNRNGDMVYNATTGVKNDGSFASCPDDRKSSGREAPLKTLDKIKIEQGNFVINMVMKPLTISNVEYENKVITGNFDYRPETALTVEIVPDEPGLQPISQTTSVDEMTSDWRVEFDPAVTPELSTTDIIRARIGDTTAQQIFTWRGLPRITANLTRDDVFVEGLLGRDTGRFIILDGDGNEVYTSDLQIDSQGRANFPYATTGFQFNPGMRTVVEGVGFSRELTFPENLAITTFDAENNQLQGNGPADAELFINLPNRSGFEPYRFNTGGDGNWSIDLNSLETPIDLLPNDKVYVEDQSQENNRIIAEYVECHTIQVINYPNNGGFVETQPAGNCPNGGYVRGTRVRLVSMPENGFTFLRWSGDLNSLESSALVVIGENDLNITANFSLSNESLLKTAPVLLQPAANAQITDNQPKFAWEMLPGLPADYTSFYELDISDGSTFASSLERTSRYYGPWDDDLGTLPYSLKEGKWYWRVRGGREFNDGIKYDRTYSPWSEIRSFTIDLTPPAAAPKLLLPDDAASTTGVPTFAWQSDPNATYYLMCLQTVSSGDCENNNLHRAASSAFRPGGVAAGSYFWKVRGCDLFDRCSDWSAERQVVFTLTQPARPMQLKPAYSAVFNKEYFDTHNSIELTWEPIPNADSYILNWTYDPANWNQHVLDSLTTNTADWEETNPDGVIYWRVAGKNPNYDDPAKRLWSETRIFTVDRVAPQAPDRLNPQSSAAVIGSPELNWQSPGADRFMVAVYHESEAPENLAFVLSNTAVNSLKLPALPDGDYLWAVKAGDTTGNWSDFATETFTITEAVPDQPVLTQPANKHLTRFPAVRFTWQASPFAERYKIQIATTNNFANPVLDETLVDTIQETYLPDGVYYWRVRGINRAALPGAWSTVQMVTVNSQPLAAPSLSSPGNGAILANVPVLSWKAVPGAISYRVTINDHRNELNFRTIYDLTKPSVQPAFLKPNTTYTWDVRAVDAAGNESPRSRSFTFSIGKALPGKITLLTPANNTLLGEKDPNLINFTWKADANAAFYQLEYSSDLTFTAWKDLTEIKAPQTSLEAYRPYDGVKFWRVRAVNADGVAGAWSTVYRFTRDITPPQAPLHKNPVADAIVTGIPTFNWSPSAEAVRYQVQVVSTSDPQVVVHQSSILKTVSYKPAYLEAGQYGWQIRAVDAAGNWGDWGSLRFFTVLPNLPTAVKLLSPVNNAFNTSLVQELKWNPSAFAQSYELAIASDAAFRNPVAMELIGKEITALSYTAVFPGEGKYYWRVRGCYQNDLINPHTHACGPWSTVSYLTVDTQAPANIVPIVPGAEFTGNPMFKWSAPAGAKTYDFQLLRQGEPAWRYVKRGLTSPTHTPTTLLAEGNYTWSVRVCDAGGNCSDWCSARALKVLPAAPKSPTLLEPVANKTLRDPKVTLRWTASAYASSYVVQTSKSYLLTPVIEVVTGATSNPFMTSPFTGETQTGLVYWRVKACNSANVCSAWSKTASYYIDRTEPAAPVLVSPADKTTGLKWVPTLSWHTPSSDTRSYLIKIEKLDQDNNILETQQFSGTSTTSFKPTNLMSGNYRWSVAAVDAAGNQGAFSTPRTFAIMRLTAPAPILRSPLNGTKVTKYPVYLGWAEMPGFGRFQVQISRSPDFTENVTDFYDVDSDNYLEYDYGYYNATLYWRVRAYDADDNPGAFSQVYSFTVDTLKPGMVSETGRSPVNGAALTTTSPKFVWRSVIDAATYDLMISPYPGSIAPLMQVERISTNTYQPVSLPSGKYYWMVRAIDAAGNRSSWNTPLPFTVK